MGTEGRLVGSHPRRLLTLPNFSRADSGKATRIRERTKIREAQRKIEKNNEVREVESQESQICKLSVV